MNNDKIIQVNGFGVKNTYNTQCDYMLVALTENGKVLMSIGDGIWTNVGPQTKTSQDALKSEA